MSFKSSPDARAACDRYHAVMLDGQALLDYYNDLSRVEENFQWRSLSFPERVILTAVFDELGRIDEYLQDQSRNSTSEE